MPATPDHGDEDGTREPYAVGVVGVGHWATTFADAMTEDLTFSHAVDVVPYEEKQELLDALGIPADAYLDLTVETDGVALPDVFLDELDAVQIASPITFHEAQTLQALQQDDLVVVTEKAYGPERGAYERVKAEVDDTDGVTYPHLHYLWKQPTRFLDEELHALVEKYGQIQAVEATFIEEYSETDRRRNWLFEPENGGIVMDWIHPIEVLTTACGATFTDVSSVQSYMTDDRLSVTEPTAVESTYELTGDLYTGDAQATIRIGKGFEDGATRKAFRFHLTDAVLDVEYAGSGAERAHNEYGQIHVRTENGIETTLLDGKTPYDVMADQLYTAIRTGETPISDDDLMEMYRVVDETREHLADARPITDQNAVRHLQRRAWERTGRYG